MGRRSDSKPSLFEDGDPQLPSPDDDAGFPKQDRFTPTTENGYALNEVISAIQKAVRRGRCNEALFWTHELVKSKSRNYVAYFWRRMCLIASEECADKPEVAMVVGQLAANAYLSTKEWKGRCEGIMEAQAVLFACRARKSREAVDAMTVINRAKVELGLRIAVPDAALDLHTRQGREMGKDLNDFRDNGRLCAGKLGRNDYEELNWGPGTAQPLLGRPGEDGAEPDVELPPRCWPSTVHPIKRDPETGEALDPNQEFDS